MNMPELNLPPTLKYAREWSMQTLQSMELLLDTLKVKAPDVTLAAISGSIGRLEGMAHSDCDLIVLVNHDAVKDPSRYKHAMHAVWQALEPINLPLPKTSGIYATPSSHEQICDHSSLGQVADDKNIFGKRLQVLLDARPVYGHEAFNRLKQGILNRYAAGFLIYDQNKEWVYLLNDLIRYLRSYCSWHQFDLSSDPIDSWYMRNAKLRNSRIPMVAALIFMLGECSKENTDKIGWLNKHLDMTMLERIKFVYNRNNDDNFDVFLDAYEYFMERLNRESVRKKLVETTPSTFEELNKYKLDEYNELHQNSKIILRELTRFTLARRGQWSDAFFEYLLF